MRAMLFERAHSKDNDRSFPVESLQSSKADFCEAEDVSLRAVARFRRRSRYWRLRHGSVRDPADLGIAAERLVELLDELLPPLP